LFGCFGSLNNGTIEISGNLTRIILLMNNPVSNRNKLSKTIQVNSKKVSCDGDDKQSKHPLVYLNMGNNDSVTCPYCGKCFTTKPSL
jgi:uncharacterized Zn-finger protein